MFDPDLVKLTAQALATDPSHVEKDWHVVRAIAAIADVDVPGVVPVFSGGTSLSAAWQLINRFSEDVDFKVLIDAPTASAASHPTRQVSRVGDCRPRSGRFRARRRRVDR